MKIDDIKLKIISDSRGKDTLETTIIAGNLEATASVPSGKSTGATEMAVVPPSQALDKLSWLISQFRDHDFIGLEQFDKLLITLDGTENKSNLGGNLMLSLSMAFVRLLAKSANQELFELISRIAGGSQTTSGKAKLPLCFFNLIEGGVHAENSLPFQEYLLIPQTRSPKESLGTVLRAIKLLEEKIRQQYGQVKQGDEGGYAIASQDPAAGLQILQELIDQNNLKSKIGLDVAASTFYRDGNYKVGDKMMRRDDLVAYYQLLTTTYPLLSIEDPFDEEDWQGFSNLQSRFEERSIGSSVWIIGDDLLTTNIKRIKKAEELAAVNAVLIKPNQIGTVTETIQAVNLAKSYGWKIIVSHRSGETMDDFITDLSFGVGADGLKSGCPLQKERLVKYERLIEIESRIWRI